MNEITKPTARPEPRIAVADPSDEEHGSAPHLHIQQTWALYLNSRDMLLVLKSLGNRIEADEEFDEAEALGDRLTLLREKAALDINKNLIRAAEHVRGKTPAG